LAALFVHLASSAATGDNPLVPLHNICLPFSRFVLFLFLKYQYLIELSFEGVIWFVVCGRPRGSANLGRARHFPSIDEFDLLSSVFLSFYDVMNLLLIDGIISNDIAPRYVPGKGRGLFALADIPVRSLFASPLASRCASFFDYFDRFSFISKGRHNGDLKPKQSESESRDDPHAPS